MIDGEAITQLFYMVGASPNRVAVSLDLPSPRNRDCCSDFCMNVLADIADSDSFKNDKNSFLFVFPDMITQATFYLQKEIDGDFQTVATLNNNMYGTFYPLGFFTNTNNENYIGYLVEWRKVLTLQGTGSYLIEMVTYSPVDGGETIDSLSFDLRAYTPDRANGTVKIEYYISDEIADTFDDKKTRLFDSLNWYNAIRINGIFGYDESKYTTDFIKYENGQKVWVSDEQEPEYTLKTKLLPGSLHRMIKTDILQADTILITDYNKNNGNTHIQRAVKRNSDYSPVWNGNSKLAKVEVKFINEYNNYKRHRC